MNLQLDIISYKSRFREIPALYKIIFTCLLGAITYLSHVVVQVIIFIGGITFLLVQVKIPARILLKWIFIPSLFLLLSMPAMVIGVSQGAGSNHDIWLSIVTLGDWRFYISKSGLDAALSAIFRALSLFICVFALFITTPFTQILKAFPRMGAPQALLDVLVSMYRFIFIFLQYTHELNCVVISRQGHVTWGRRLHSAGLIAVQLFVKTFEKYKRMSMVIESRGFTDQLFYADEEKNTVSWKHFSFGVLTLLLLIGMEWWWRSFYE
ncbi:energy-coupling factor transporter transmembrane component T family protein [Schinkia sp. CFF1]